MRRLQGVSLPLSPGVGLPGCPGPSGMCPLWKQGWRVAARNRARPGVCCIGRVAFHLEMVADQTHRKPEKQRSCDDPSMAHRARGVCPLPLRPGVCSPKGHPSQWCSPEHRRRSFLTLAACACHGCASAHSGLGPVLSDLRGVPTLWSALPAPPPSQGAPVEGVKADEPLFFNGCAWYPWTGLVPAWGGS